LKKAVFFDRDGVINEDAWPLTKIENVVLIPQIAEAIKKLNKNFLIIIVTNQGSIAKGLATIDEIKTINNYIIQELEVQGAKIDGIYFCPHHPDFSGLCKCRKPEPGLILESAEEHEIDLSKSFIIGDKTSDIKAGKNVGLKTILVKTGDAGKDGRCVVTPDFEANTPLDAAEIILKTTK